jgi:sodium/hydrogen antiporter
MPSNSFANWALIIGLLLITVAMSGSLLRRLPLSTAMLYLAAGYWVGPAGWHILAPDPLVSMALIEPLTEVAVLISLFAAGLKLGLPFSDRRWYLPIRLAFGSMAITVALIALVGVFGLGLPLGAAILLGAILAPTDPVLASDVQVEDADDRDRLRFTLTVEGGLNDGAAFPFVMLGLGLLGLHDLGDRGWRWLAMDVLWASAGGLMIGAVLGTLVGRLVLYLRVHHREAVGLDEFLALGLIGLSYGLALLSQAYGFLAVFAAGLALQRINKGPESGPLPSSDATLATNPVLAGSYMMQTVRSFNAQLERIGELAVVIVLGAMLAYTHATFATLGLVAFVFFVARPAAVWLGLLGAPVGRDQLVLMSWFGIRGIGSVYYLMYAINHGLPIELAEPLISLTLGTVAVSIVVHGVSVTPLMNLYARRKARRRARRLR